MNPRSPNNLAASIRQRLLNRSKRDRRPFQELLQYYAMERFLYRLSLSAYANHFVLKGALMLRAWGGPMARSTMDIDMLGRTSNDEAKVSAQLKEILMLDTEPDGMAFDETSIRTESIAEDANYSGVRVLFKGELDSARINVQLDIGFGDVVHPASELLHLPTMLDMPAPRLLCYTRESAIAEKFEAMVKLRELNSRMKDFYDIWTLSRQFDFRGATLAEAIRLTFQRRDTLIDDVVVAFTDEFARSKQGQWSAFRKRLGQDYVPEQFIQVVVAVRAFLTPMMNPMSDTSSPELRWPAPGPWT